MRRYEDAIRELLEQVIANESMELIHVECLQMGARWLVRLFLDKEGGIAIDNCALISDIAGDILNVNDVPPGAYTLEVSSPGIDRPLSRKEDFVKFAGEEVSLKLDEKVADRKNIKGYLKEVRMDVDREEVVIENERGIFTVPFAVINKANLCRLQKSK